MKKSIRKYLYLISDVANILLKKERIKAEKNAHKLRRSLVFVTIILLISILLNIYFYINYVKG